jgi:hypothetical protein
MIQFVELKMLHQRKNCMQEVIKIIPLPDNIAILKVEKNIQNMNNTKKKHYNRFKVKSQ